MELKNYRSYSGRYINLNEKSVLRNIESQSLCQRRDPIMEIDLQVNEKGKKCTYRIHFLLSNQDRSIFQKKKKKNEFFFFFRKRIKLQGSRKLIKDFLASLIVRSLT